MAWVSIHLCLFALFCSEAFGSPFSFLVQSKARPQDAPLVRTINGTYAGKYLESYKQDAFLGIPYAQPPLGNLRFRRPLPLNASWTGSRDAKEYGSTCTQTGNRTDLSEDCLSLNSMLKRSLESKTAVIVNAFISRIAITDSLSQLFVQAL
jgi:hypothetical protein